MTSPVIWVPAAQSSAVCGLTGCVRFDRGKADLFGSVWHDAGLRHGGITMTDTPLARAAWGSAVRDRLSQRPGVVKVPAPSLEMFILRDFLTGEECAALIAMIEADRKPSRLMTDAPDAAFRTSETCNFDPDAPVVLAVEARLHDLLGIDLGHGERLQGQRYAVGQEFKPHHDYLRPTSPYWARQQQIGGQRTWTTMAFLNVPEEGGETFFPKLRLKLPPRQGSLVVWNNLDQQGEPNEDSLHQGLPVRAGVKYIFTKWYRERPWGVPAGGDIPEDDH
jgi:prolyl 4-hydroxylase